MSNILFSVKNKTEIDKFIDNPSHSLLLIGKFGSGKKTLAEYIAQEVLNLSSIEELNRHPYFSFVVSENNVISIEKIRNLKKFFQLKTTGNNLIRRVVIIENAETMNDEAQNAILKILEEPPDDSLIILTVSNESLLKPTVLSRTQKIKLFKPTKDEVIKHYVENGANPSVINKNYIFTNGAIGLMGSLIDGDNQSRYSVYIEEAKTILSSNMFDRLTFVDALAKDKDTLSVKLFCLKQIAKTAFTQAIDKNSEKLINRWLKTLEAVQNSEDQLEKGANTKLLLTNLFLNM